MKSMKTGLMLGLAGAILGSSLGMEEDNIREGGKFHPKLPLTNKQKKARKRSKAAKQARKRQR